MVAMHLLLRRPSTIFVVAVALQLISAAPSHRCPPQGPPSFTFFIHNRVYDPDVNNSEFTSVYSDPPAQLQQPNPKEFGVRSTFEMPITAGPDPESQSLGVARGFWVYDSMAEFVLLHVFTAKISGGKYKGTLAIVGQEEEAEDARVLAVVGGTGDFLAARGSAISKRIVLNRPPPANWTLSFNLDLYY